MAVSGQVRGTVTDSASREPLPSAPVWWAGTSIGVEADGNGRFDIGLVKGYDKLVAGYEGYLYDTLTVGGPSENVEFRLRAEQSLDEIVVMAASRGNYTKLDGILKGEVISFAGLTKMACCNLAESFENNASVTVGYSDAITGARQIKMLGLAGIYTQILDETRPIMRGLGSPYGLSYTPGMWLESIQLAKGVTSVTGGHEAIAGQINLEYRKPNSETPLFVNVYADQDLRTEINVAAAQRLTDRLSHIMLAHYSANPLRRDHNGDGFIDTPTGTQFNVASRYLYLADNGIQMRAGFKYVDDSRLSGQMDFEPYAARDGFELYRLYGSEIRNRNLNAYFKIAVPLGKYVWDNEKQSAERSNLAVIADADHFGTDSYFGQLKDYRAHHNLLRLNAMYSWNINSRHKLISGVSAQSDNYREFLRNGRMIYTDEDDYVAMVANALMERSENTAGVYAEYSYSYSERFTAIAGLRGDYSVLHGFFATPRAHVRWAITPRLILRGSSGMGYRTANLITDNLWALATGRMLVGAGGVPLSEYTFTQMNTQEKSLTSGGSLTWSFPLGRDRNASLSFDYFHSKFFNQVLADQEYDGQNVWFYSTGGRSYTDTYQIDFNWTPFSGFDVLATFRYNDAKVTLRRPGGGSLLIEKPLTDRYKGLINLQYATRFRRWIFDFTAQINGPMRLPTQDGDLSQSEHSPAYPIFYAQVTRRLGVSTSVYLGCENITDYMQHHPVTWEGNVHSTSFNSSRIWGPLMGRKIYAGVRINF